MSTGDWDLFLGPLELERAETGGADRWVLQRRGFPGVARVNKVTPVSLEYPLSVFNKNSTLSSCSNKIEDVYLKAPYTMNLGLTLAFEHKWNLTINLTRLVKST